MARYLEGQEQFSNEPKQTQVFQATHDGAGNRLPHLNRSFISFSYGGKYIEDFGLIITNQERLERGLYAPFTDITSTYDTLNGQLYWGTKLEPNQLPLTLSTDGMTQNQLDNFREWFAPGVARELILSEHPNRAIIARIAEPPVMSVIPFEEKVEVKFSTGNDSIETSTTLYKGDITINFVMDEPNWYGKLTYMPTYINPLTLEESAAGVNSSLDKGMVKIMLEDGIPHQSNLLKTMFLGNNILVSEETRVGFAKVGKAYLGIITATSEGLPVGNNNTQYLFYSGTAISYPTIKFTIGLTFSNNYITTPKNNISDYSYIQIGDKKMYFTTPSILTGYNQAIKFIKTSSGTTALIDLKDKIIAGVNEYNVRAWAIACVSQLINTNSSTTTLGTGSVRANLLAYMRKFFQATNPSVTFVFDSKTGEAYGDFSVNTFISDVTTDDNYNTVRLNVGDMIRSDYIIVQGRDTLSNNGEIVLNNCHKITSNEALTNVLVFFKNMYL